LIFEERQKSGARSQKSVEKPEATNPEGKYLILDSDFWILD
jgi:hypothetical protein